MAFQLSPGVNVSEVDLTTTVPAVSTSIGAIAGHFQWGPVDEIRTIGSETELVNTFGKPISDSRMFEDFFSAANFLGYSNNLKVVRVAEFDGAYNSVVNGAGYAYVKNKEQFEMDNYIYSNPGYGIAKYPGSIGDSLKIYIVDNGNYDANLNGSDTNEALARRFNGAPNTSDFATAKGFVDAYDELHVLIVDEVGKFTGTPGATLEKFEFLSKFSDATKEGVNNYWVDVINKSSQYLWIVDNPGTSGSGTISWGTESIYFNSGNAFDQFAAYEFGDGSGDDDNAVKLTGGYDDYSSTVVANNSGYNLFAQPEVAVDLVICGRARYSKVKAISDIVSARKDCMMFISPTRWQVVNNTGSEEADILNYYQGSYLNLNSSYAVGDNNWKYQYDKYNDTYRWIPCNADVAGLCARTDQTNDPWFSPAGYNRGILRNVLKLGWNATKANRDNLYVAGINSIITQPGLGTVLFGDKTLTAKPSAFDRINVRRLFIVLEKAISNASKFSLFELNDEFTRAQFVGLVEPYLRDVRGRRGIYDFKVVCDESNNTPQVIDSNSFVGDIYIKPARSINFIQLNFVAVKTGVEFSEVVGQF